MDDRPPDGRGKNRAKVHLLCDMRVGQSPWQKVSLQDLSPEGFRMMWQPRISVGSKLWIKIGMLAPLLAEVRWIEPNAVGCRFNAPLSEYVFDHLVQLATKG